MADQGDRAGDTDGDGARGGSLVGFLLARLAEDERAALAAQAGPLHRAPPGPDPLAAHLARHGPGRVLREVAAKRAVVEAWLDAVRARLVEHRDPDGIELAEVALAHLAAVYADHPDYHPGWRPPEPRAPERQDAAGARGPTGPAGTVLAFGTGRARRVP